MQTIATSDTEKAFEESLNNQNVQSANVKA